MIRIRDLTKYYGELCALDRLSLDVSQGQILGLLGPNGAGKTTALRILTGYYRPTSGTVTVQGHELEGSLLRVKEMMGYLPESIPLYRNLLVYDYLRFLARVRNLEAGTREARIQETARTCGLRSVMHKAVGELSKGYQQRVGLAHAMLHDPQILILDEPTSGLDPNQILEIRDLIRQVGRQKTVILSTHILSEAEATCDRMAIIHQGRIVADGTPSSLKQSAGSGRTLRLGLKNAPVGEIEPVLGGVHGVERVRDADEHDGEVRVRLECRDEPEVRDAVYRAVRETDWILVELTQETRTLENIFKELTQEPAHEPDHSPVV
jgi:ABC-2 type transport system ATP-binding protein